MLQRQNGAEVEASLRFSFEVVQTFYENSWEKICGSQQNGLILRYKNKGKRAD